MIEYITLAFIIVITIFLFIKGINVTINVEHKYPEPQLVEIPDIYNEEGDPKIDDNNVRDFNEALKGIHAFMTDSEEE